MKTVLIGGGKFAGVTISMFRDRAPFAGYIDDVNERAYVEEHYGLPKLGTTEQFFSRCKPADHDCVLALGSEGDTAIRWKYFEAFRQRGFLFPTLISSRALVLEQSSLGEGTLVQANAVIHPFVKIGRNCVISTGAILGHDSVLGDNVYIGPGVILNGSCSIGDHVFIGTGSVVIQKLSIGERSLVGAGSCVIKSLPPGSKAFGNPARTR